MDGGVWDGTQAVVGLWGQGGPGLATIIGFQINPCARASSCTVSRREVGRRQRRSAPPPGQRCVGLSGQPC
eukprot:350196-Chlamydomonas_euryale.AAC.4